MLDLKQGEDLELARRLISSADVVIENFRPGVMRRLGLDPKRITEAQPHLIWCSLPGFAEDDPRAQIPAWEGLLGAVTGATRSRPSACAATPAVANFPQMTVARSTPRLPSHRFLLDAWAHSA